MRHQISTTDDGETMVFWAEDGWYYQFSGSSSVFGPYPSDVTAAVAAGCESTDFLATSEDPD